MATGNDNRDRKERIERQLDLAQQITHIGSWEWDARTDTVTWSDELYRIYGFQPRDREITLGYFLGRLHSDDRERVQREVGAAMQRGARFEYPERIVRPDGTIRELETVGEVARDDGGAVIGLIGTCRDVTEARRGERLRNAEARVLEMIAAGGPLEVTLTEIVEAIEEHSPPTIGSILLLDATGSRVKHGAAPSLPDEFNRAVDGVQIGPTAGSCGTAAYLKKPILVTDIEIDPLWTDYRDLARPHGLRACWSTPIVATDDRVLGTFALYYREPRAPTTEDLELIARATHLAGIAIERRQLEDQLRALSAHAESVREEERSGIAREIHDELGQALTALKMDVAWLSRRISGTAPSPREALLEKLGTMSELIDDVIDQVRRISAELRPGVLDDLGLLAAIEWQGSEFEKRTGTACDIRSNLEDERLERGLSTAIFRIFQEALTNVARHAEARRVDVLLERTPSAISLEVRDDGRGIAPEAMRSPASLGLLGIRERARALGGSARIAAAEGGGTLVSLEIPLAPRREL